MTGTTLELGPIVLLNSCNCRKIDKKKGALGRLGVYIWWRRRESTPRPSVLHHKVYMLSFIY